MSPQANPISTSTARVTIPVMGVCMALSVLVHVGSAVGAGAYLSQRQGLSFEGQTRIDLPDMAPPTMPEEQPLMLGRQESRTASIAWLGVVRDAIEGDGQESQVEQAELTITEGERQEQSAQPAPTVAPQPDVLPVEPQQAQPEVAETPPVAESQPEPVSEPEPEPEPEPETIEPEVHEPEPIEAESPIHEDEPEAVIDASERTAPVVIPESQPERQPEPVVEPEPEPETESESESQAEPTEAQPELVTSPSLQPTLPTTSAKPQGKPGEVDDRESVASIIKRAKEVRARTLNRPLAGEGLEIKTVEPKFSATVRFTQLPRNPIVMIRFNAQGKVVKADFLRDEEKRRVYDTGSKGVDEPLISAIYQWRASGKQIDALDPDDPDSTIEIAMKIIFRDED
ncbi:MAG: hypothetical protein ACF8MF_09550 [Phycisphaerales bacterium JB052]